MTPAEAILALLVGILFVIVARLGENVDRLKASDQNLSRNQTLLSARIEAVNQRHERKYDKLRGIDS